MLGENFSVATETDRRNLYLKAASEIVDFVFRGSLVEAAFRRAGIFPPSIAPVLNNPCLINQPPAPVARTMRTNVDISKEMIMDTSEIPDRKKATLKAQAEARAEARKRKQATASAASASNPGEPMPKIPARTSSHISTLAPNTLFQ